MEKFILVADDDPAILKLISTIIEGEGFLVATAKDGKEAYAALKSGVNIVAAIVDNMMPYIGGVDIVKFMRSDERFSNVPIIMMTGDRNPSASAKALAAGAVAFLPKPFSNTQLRSTLRTLIQKREGQAAG
jgi:CheY-like chemotaxis protein